MNRRSFCRFGLSAATALGAGQARADEVSQFHTHSGDSASKDIRNSQLFLDDTWIEDTTRVKRVWVPARIQPEPVLRPEMPWEGNQVILYGTVLRLKNEWRMYYGTWNPPAPALFCMATSTDGLRWTRPKLNLVDFEGSKANNILWAPPPNAVQDCPTIVYEADDPVAPFKMMYFVRQKVGEGEYIAFSKDGIVWKHHPEPVLTTTDDRTNLMTSRDATGRYIAFLRHRNMMTRFRARSIWRSHSTDFLRWTEPELILRPDLLDDPNTELYGMTGFRYSDVYIGMLEKWRHNPDVIEVELAWSHDGNRWMRPVQRSPFIGASFPWNKGWTTCASNPPLQVNNQLLFYFGGRSEAHGMQFPQSHGVIGLATTDIDRFAAIQADFREGWLATRTMRWPGGDLVVRCSNARYADGHPRSGGGIVRVEVRDADNRPVAGYSGEDSATWEPPRSFDPDPPLRWPANRSLAELAGRQIRLVFLMRDARLYSFRAA